MKKRIKRMVHQIMQKIAFSKRKSINDSSTPDEDAHAVLNMQSYHTLRKANKDEALNINSSLLRIEIEKSPDKTEIRNN